MASLFIRKYRTLGCCKSAISKVAHTIEKIEPACCAYLQWVDLLPSTHFILETLQLYQGKSHAFINLSCTRS
jgi:hypothetical protein